MHPGLLYTDALKSITVISGNATLTFRLSVNKSA